MGRGEAGGGGGVWVPDGDDNLVLIEWEHGQHRDGVWEMGPIPGRVYEGLHDDYMSHRISEEEFLARYHDSDNYRVTHPDRLPEGA